MTTYARIEGLKRPKVVLHESVLQDADLRPA